VLFSSNSGATWLKQNSGTNRDITCATFIDSDHGWIAGGGTMSSSNTETDAPLHDAIILHTTNGGNKWLQQMSGKVLPLKGIAFSDLSNGWAVGGEAGYGCDQYEVDGTILHTTNGGIDWISQPSGTHNCLNAVVFANTRSGWIVGTGGTILHVENGSEEAGVKSGKRGK